MKKSYVLSAIVSVALLVSAMSSPVYAGVIQRNATGALTNKEQIGTAASTDGTTITYKDKDGKVVGEEPDKNNWLGPDGVAKMPSYSDLNVEFEKGVNDTFQLETTILKTGHRKGDFQYPEINPATGRPLWETQPFWREDGSFDLYGYLKQFIPRVDELDMVINYGKTSYEKGVNAEDCMMLLRHDQKDGDDQPERYRQLILFVPLVNDPTFTIKEDFDLNDYKECAQTIILKDAHLNPSTSYSTTITGYIRRDELGPKARLTGSRDKYIYEIEIRQLEEVMRSYIQDYDGNHYDDHPERRFGTTGVEYLKIPWRF